MADDRGGASDDLPVLEPEVLPPQGRRASHPFEDRLRLARYALVLDGVNLLIRGPFAVRFGFPIGVLAAFLLLQQAGWRGRRLAVACVLAGLYVMVPDPGFVPLAALAALFAPLGGPPMVTRDRN